MKVEEEILGKMIQKTQGTEEQLKHLGYNFWVSKEYTEYPKTYKGFPVWKTQTLSGNTIYLATEEAFFKSKL